MIIRNDHYKIPNPRVLHLAYHVVQDMGEHYSSVRMIGDDSKQPALPIELDIFKLEEQDEFGFMLQNGEEQDDSSDNNSEENYMELIEQVINNFLKKINN